MSYVFENKKIPGNIFFKVDRQNISPKKWIWKSYDDISNAQKQHADM